MSTQWKDRGRESRLKIVDAEIVVHRHIDHQPDEWLCTCHDLGVDKWSAGHGSLEAAKKKVVLLVRAKLETMLKALDKASP